MQTEFHHIMASLPKDILLEKGYLLDRALPKLSKGRLISEFVMNNMYIERFLDMALTFYVPIDLADSPDKLVSFTITERIMDNTGITPKELRQAALTNLEKSYEICSLSDMLSQLGCDMEAETQVPVIVATTRNRLHGASRMVSPGVLNEIYQSLGKFFIIPSSIHEFLAVSCNEKIDAQALAELLVSINTTELTEADRLSDSVYVWDGKLLKKAFS